MSDDMRKHAKRMLKKWAPRFGFGHYLLIADDETPGKDDVWAHIRGNVEEETAIVWLSPLLEQLTPKQVEHVMVHELMHLLFAFAGSGESAEEMACNRIAAILVGQEHGARFLLVKEDGTVEADAKAHFDDDEREALLSVLPHIIVRMPTEHRQMLLWMFYDYPGKSLRELEALVHVPKSTLARRRDAALAALRERFQ